jgi:oligosaccharide repeat unit polymerase
VSQARNNPVREDPVWWLHPVAIFVGLSGLTGVASFLAGPETYLEMWGMPKYVTGFTVLVIVAIVVAFSGGVWLALANQSGLSSESEWRGTVSLSWTLLLFNISFWVCVMAYVFWAGLGISRGLGLAVLKAVLTSVNDVDTNVYTLRMYLQTVPGVTTLTQVGIAAVVLGCLIGAAVGWRLVRRKLAILLVLALFRAVIYSERLAFLELAIPLLVLLLAEPACWKRSRALRTLVRIAPAVGPIAIYIVFTGFEYLRSWTIYYSSRQSSLLLFGFWRLVGYYVTSFNNSAYLISSLHHPLGAPYFSLGFLWEFPVVNAFVKDLFGWVHLDYNSYMDLLAVGANPEFNNPGGVLSPVIDFGVLGGLAYWAVMGLVTGYLYRLYLCKHPLGMCIYPIAYLTISELPRYIYWGEGRAFPALAYLLLSVVVLLHSATRYQSSTQGQLAAD